MRSKKVSSKEIDQFFQDLLKRKKPEELKIYFSQLLTERELNDIARRHQAVEYILSGKTYKEIQEKLQMSAVTICRLSAKVGYGVLENNRLLKTRSVKRKNKRKVIRYKGAPTLRELIGD